MNCMICNAPLNASDHCPKCGCKVTAQKKAWALSGLYYNQGLEKAQVRDLSGAITCLKRCLKMNKLNIQARNLLGLVYFETGEVVAALSQWVISKNMMPQNNVAIGYIEKLQKDGNRLEEINNSIKKYNQCLEYCRSGNIDMAKLQLKKVLASNPKLIKGYHLLSLIYIHEEEYEKARRQLKAAAKIDKSNTTTLRFLREVEEQTGRRTNLEPRFGMREKVREGKDGSLIYKSGNDVVIQPPEFREKTITNTLINLILGLVVGAAALWFLVVPAITQNVNEAANEKVVDYSNQMATQAAELERLQEQMNASQESVDTAQSQIEAAQQQTTDYENLLKSWDEYQQGNFTNAANAIAEVNSDNLSVEGKSIYDTIMNQVGDTLKQQYRNEGINYINAGDYDSAIESLQKAVNIGTQDRRSMYYLAQAYAGKGDVENAVAWYQKVVDNYPGTQNALDAQDYIDAHSDEISSADSEDDTQNEGDSSSTAGNEDAVQGTTEE
ncbi:MAG TPA: tetratricopeptide repeat protein [Candidatus Blautia ornithocaccae]|nr:tetratricopeptide repeat protein [Candidatus Blautia ornithocaccae]